MEIENDIIVSEEKKTFADNDSKNNEQSFDKTKAKKNIIVSILFKIILLALSLVARRFLIKYSGNDANGLNSLYISVIGFLAIADLGIGTAIVYCMYEPIANNNISKVRQLYTLFRKLYTIIGLVVLSLGLIVLIFLPILSKGYDDKNTLYITYIMSLLAVVITYFYSAKMSLINAYKNNYISTFFTSIGLIVQYVLQIIVLVITKSFIMFCLCKIIASLLQYIIFLFYNKHKDITTYPEKIDDNTKNQVTKNVKAMFMHKIGDVIFGTVDSLVISAVIGVIILGYYSNYLVILTAMNEVLKLFIVPLTAVIGHMGVKATNMEKTNYLKFFYSINFVLGIVFYLGYYSVCDDLVTILFGDGLTLDKDLVIVISITYFIQFMRQSASVFKDSFGLFYKDRYVSLIAAICNAILSISFAYIFGIYGVLIATILVDILIYHIVEPYVLFKYGLEKKPWKYYIINYSLIAFFVGEIYLFSLINISVTNIFLHLLICGCISLAFNFLPTTIVILINPKIRNKIVRIFKKEKATC